MHRHVRGAAVPGALILLCLTHARPAAAQSQLSPFVMGDNSSTTWIGGELGLGMLAEQEVTVVTLSGLVDWALSSTTKIYGRVPLAWVDGDGFDGGALGNLTVGGRFLFPSRGGGSTSTMWSAHAAASLPTASDDGESGAAAFAAAVYELPHDAGWYAPDATTVRAGGNFHLQTPSLFFQAEMGLHLLFVDDGDDASLIKYGLALGVQAGSRIAIVGELSGYSDLLDDEAFGPDDTRTALDLGVRWRGRSIVFGGRLYLPLDDVYREADAVGLMFDLRAPL